jgi:hypothetical protein
MSWALQSVLLDRLDFGPYKLYMTILKLKLNFIIFIENISPHARTQKVNNLYLELYFYLVNT